MTKGKPRCRVQLSNSKSMVRSQPFHLNWELSMPKHTVNWVNDHTQICDRLDERVQLMQNYLDSKPDDFDGITVKQFLLSQAREQVPWYRQSIDALDFVGCVACCRSLETGQSFLEHYLPAYNFRENRARDRVSARCGIPTLT